MTSKQKPAGVFVVFVVLAVALFMLLTFSAADGWQEASQPAPTYTAEPPPGPTNPPVFPPCSLSPCFEEATPKPGATIVRPW